MSGMGAYQARRQRAISSFLGESYIPPQNTTGTAASTGSAGVGEEGRAEQEMRYATGKRRRYSALLTGGEGAPLGMGQISRIFAGGL